MALPFYNWSRTAASNSTADSTVNWAEGQLPSTVNDSARAMMASTAAYRDDVAGAIATGGTSTAYTVTTYQVFDTLAHLANQVVAFTPHTTNGATVTLNVDGLGAKPLRSAPSVELAAGVLIQGTPYVALYNNSDAVFYLYGVSGAPYLIPIGGSIDYWGTSAPNSNSSRIKNAAGRRIAAASITTPKVASRSDAAGVCPSEPANCQFRTMPSAPSTRPATANSGQDKTAAHSYMVHDDDRLKLAVETPRQPQLEHEPIMARESRKKGRKSVLDYFFDERPIGLQLVERYLDRKRDRDREIER